MSCPYCGFEGDIISGGPCCYGEFEAYRREQANRTLELIIREHSGLSTEGAHIVRMLLEERGGPEWHAHEGISVVAIEEEVMAQEIATMLDKVERNG